MHSAENDVLAVAYDAYGGPEVLKLRSIPAPPLAQDQVLVEVRAASMNPVDWKVRSGMLQKFFPVAFPTITGRDGAGEVMAAAADADASLVGKRVCFLAQRGAGTWSQKIALQASLAVPIPSGMSYEEAASLPLAGISAWVGLVQTADVKPGMRVLIHAAAGGVGSMAVQIARLRGATVIATARGATSILCARSGPRKQFPTIRPHSRNARATSTWYLMSSVAMCTGGAMRSSSVAASSLRWLLRRLRTRVRDGE
jgi:NADPH:quinone reductase-like Zn-dependent oxidoreductase